MNKSIQQLEAEITALDPATAQQVRKVVVKSETLSTTSFKHFVNVQGKVEANKNIIVSPQTSGILLKITVREGQKVSAGQLLAQVDDAVMKRSIAEVQSSLDLANILYEKQKNLWDQEIGTEVQYLTAKSQKESLERRLATLEEQWSMTRIKAPISGTVDEILPKVGETVMAGAPAFRIVNTSDLSLKAELSESYVLFIKRGDEVKIHFPTINKEIKARVTVVGQSIDANDRTFSVEVQLPRDPMIKANMFGEMAINDRSVEKAIVVPINMVQNSEEGSFVYVAEQNAQGSWIARRKVIETDLAQDGKTLVTKGLTDGDKLITVGYKELSDGQEIVFEGEANVPQATASVD